MPVYVRASVCARACACVRVFPFLSGNSITSYILRLSHITERR